MHKKQLFYLAFGILALGLAIWLPLLAVGALVGALGMKYHVELDKLIDEILEYGFSEETNV